MQLKIHIKNNRQIFLPLGYNYQLMSAVYHLVGNDEGLSSFLHNEGWHSGGASFKLFCLSPLMGHYRIDDKHIIFDGDISFEVRSPSQEFMDVLKRELFGSGRLKLFNYKLEVRMLECFDRHFEEQEHRIKTVSPICLRQMTDDGKTLYFSPVDREFDELINLNMYRKFMAAYGQEPPTTIDLEPLVTPKKVVTKIKGTWVTAYHCSFNMHTDPSIARFVYDVGLGSRNSQGFGMIDIVEE